MYTYKYGILSARTTTTQTDWSSILLEPSKHALTYVAHKYSRAKNIVPINDEHVGYDKNVIVRTENLHWPSNDSFNDATYVYNI